MGCGPAQALFPGTAKGAKECGGPGGTCCGLGARKLGWEGLESPLPLLPGFSSPLAQSQYMPNAMDVLDCITDLLPEFLLIKLHLQGKAGRRWSVRVCPSCPGAGDRAHPTPRAFPRTWEGGGGQHRHPRDEDQSGDQNGGAVSEFSGSQACLPTLTSSKGKRSWKIRLMRAPPDSS